MTDPITPMEASQRKKDAFPSEVIECFNELITKNFDGREAVVKAKEVSRLIASRMNVKTDVVFQNGWLDVEEIYRKSGWYVEYDQPAYCESYDAFFRFKRKK